MNIHLRPGKYVVAVSGGVDSVVLLHLLTEIRNTKYEIRLFVAHYDHGIRSNSQDDRLFVENLAAAYGLAFFYEEGNLGANAGEAEARKARYKFLRRIKQQTDANAIITAHHQDDVIETAIINLLRGTTAKGLAALKSTEEIARPLLEFTKPQIIAYAKSRGLNWREDETNLDPKYLRNYVRYNLTPKLTKQQKHKLLQLIRSSSETLGEISEIIKELLPKKGEIDRQGFINLPHSVACELVASWLKAGNLAVDKKTVERLVVGLKAAKNGTRLDINKNYQFLIENGIIKIQLSSK
ncbi:tRNA lysidine(34) synthetase TilS [Candidatus Parcubacteria bacterium]|nr:tRNA lysidine(34) synthetase TilS [Candidatus Parcubacteria bacterium]